MAYVYRHIRLDKNEPFYIGIGADDTYSRASQTNSRNRHWLGVVSKTEYDIDIIFDELTWDMACEKEKEFIKMYGRRDIKTGSLVNLTDGGDGSLGVVCSEETRKKKSEVRKGVQFSQEHRENLSKTAKGRKYAGWVLKKMSDRGKLFVFTEERNRKISETLRAKYASGERVSATLGKPVSFQTREKLRKTSTGRKHTEEAKKKMSELAKGNKRNLGKHLSLETKRKIGDANRGRKFSDGNKKELSNNIPLIKN